MTNSTPVSAKYDEITFTKEQLKVISGGLFKIIYDNEVAKGVGKMITRSKVKDIYFQGVEADKLLKSKTIAEGLKILVRAEYIREWEQEVTIEKTKQLVRYLGVSTLGRKKYEESLVKIDESKPF